MYVIYIKLFPVLFIMNRLIHHVNSYNLRTHWCGENARCRLKDECYNDTNEIPSSDCANEGSVCCPDSTLPEQLCYKYGQSVFNQQNDVAVGFEKQNTTNITCANTQTPLIIGGEKASIKEFPYMAAVGFGKSRKNALWHCGGTLITTLHVVSAAHCLRSQVARSDAKWIILGAINLSNENEPGKQTFDIVKRIIHPKYKPPAKTYDIILFKLSEEAKINEYVRPACLNMDDSITVNRVFATGWGVTAYYNDENSDDLMKVTLDLIPYEDCEKFFRYDTKRLMPLGVHDSMLCAGIAEGGKDTCQGDSGGPITIGLQEPHCMYSVVGITSFGKFCAYPKAPAIYTRISYFIPWIVKEISQDLF